MPKNVPVQAPAPRVIHYIDPSAQAEVQLLTATELMVKRQRDRELYARWVVRQAEFADRDRKARRFFLGFGAIVGAAVVAAAVALVWLAVHTVMAIGLGLLAIPAAVLVLAGVAVGGHRCITVVQHWH